MEYLAHTKEDFEDVAQQLLDSLPQQEKATIVTLSGELGAGKTTLCQAIGRNLGVEENMVSPTFVLEKIYDLKDHSHFKHLIHIDAYRLETKDALSALGFTELLSHPENLILLEWPEDVDVQAQAALSVRISVQEDGTRLIETHENN